MISKEMRDRQARLMVALAAHQAALIDLIPDMLEFVEVDVMAERPDTPPEQAAAIQVAQESTRLLLKSLEAHGKDEYDAIVADARKFMDARRERENGRAS
jgi:hypothetical protein